MEFFHGDLAVFRHLQAVGALLEIGLDQEAVVLRILGQEDPQGRGLLFARAGAGNSGGGGNNRTGNGAGARYSGGSGRRPGGRSHVRLRCYVQQGGEIKAAAPSRFRFHPDPSAHEVHQAPGDAQTQAGAAVAPCHGGIGLGEVVEDGADLVAGDADARVHDGKP